MTWGGGGSCLCEIPVLESIHSKIVHGAIVIK